MQQIMGWFTGGTNFEYKALIGSLDGDFITAILTVILCMGISTAYCFIAGRWSEAAEKSPSNEAQRSLRDLKWMFTLCGIGGYLLVALEIFWPAWRLYVIFLIILFCYSWRYVFKSIGGLKSVYRYIQDRDQLVREILVQKGLIADLREELEREKEKPAP